MSETESIYVLKDGRRLGPFTVDDLFDQLEDGKIEYEDACLRSGATECERVREVLEGDLLAGPKADDPEPEAELISEPEKKTDSIAGREEDEEENEEEEFFDDLEDEIVFETPDPFSGPPSDPNAVLYAGHPSFLSYPKSLFLIAAAIGLGIWLRDLSGWYFLAGLLVALFAVSWILLERSMRLYLITPKRCEIVTGLIAKSSNEVRIEDIRTINVVKKGLPGLFGVGTVEFDSSGGSNVEVSFDKVWAADRIKGLVRRLQDAMDG